VSVTDEPRELELMVKSLTWESDGVLSMRLADAEGKPLPDWRPGAHVDVRLPNGVTRQYSLCGDPDETSAYRVAVLLEQVSRGGSTYVHQRLRPGDTVTVREPMNNFEFTPSERYLFIAGGIGITPLLPMLRSAQHQGAEWRLLYGGRRRASMAFLDEVAEYGGHVQVVAEDEQGRLDLDGWLSDPEPGTLVYCCGPEGLLAAVEQHCERWPAGSLQVERFAPKAGLDRDAGDDRAFDVYCQDSDLTVHVEADCSILASLRAAGLTVPSSCEEGICGTCETRVIEGVPDHRDSILSAAEQAENNTMMICVGRSHSDRLVLDR
jgi:ferredoxin-NADP reductase